MKQTNLIQASIPKRTSIYVQNNGILFMSNYPRISGETDDRGRFLRLLADCKTLGAKGKLEPFTTYQIYTSDDTTKIGLTLDLSYIDLDGDSATLDFSGNTTGTIGLYVTCTKIPPFNHNHIGSISKLQLDGKGAGSTRSAMTAIVFDSSTSGAGVAHIDVEKLNVHGFTKGTEYRNHAYLIRHNSIDIYDCNTCISLPNGYTDYGENLNFNGCTFYNSDTGLDDEYASGELFFSRCSFDYTTTTFVLNSAIVHCDLCHIEGKNIFNLKGTGASLQIDKSRLIYMDNSNYKPFVVTPECAGIHIKDSYINGGLFNGTGKVSIVDGGGRVFIEGSYDYNNYNGFFSDFLNEASASQPFKQFYTEVFSSQPTKIINTLNTGNINISKDTTVYESGNYLGNYSIKVNKVITDNVDAGINFIFKLRPDTTHISYNIRWKSDVNIPTNFIDCWHNFVRINERQNIITNDSGKDVLLSDIYDTSDASHIGPWLSINSNWSTFIGYVPVIKPIDSNAFKLTMNLKQMTTGNIWIDKIEVYEF